MTNWLKISDVSDICSGNGKVVMLEGKAIALFNLDGHFMAMDNRCPHRGGSLGNGELIGPIVTCPWHGWQFNCRTGSAVENETIVVRTYPLENRSDGLFISIE